VELHALGQPLDRGRGVAQVRTCAGAIDANNQAIANKPAALRARAVGTLIATNPPYNPGEASLPSMVEIVLIENALKFLLRSH
jgi:hypothetical protein